MSDEDTKCWIYSGGLPYELTEGDLLCVFSQFGEISQINLSRDKETGKSKGFCFVKYEDYRSCELAVDNLNGVKIIGRTIKVHYANNTSAIKAMQSAHVAPRIEDARPSQKRKLEITEGRDCNSTDSGKSDHNRSKHRSRQIEDRPRDSNRHDERERERDSRRRNDRESRHESHDSKYRDRHEGHSRHKSSRYEDQDRHDTKSGDNHRSSRDSRGHDDRNSRHRSKHSPDSHKSHHRSQHHKSEHRSHHSRRRDDSRDRKRHD